MMFTSAYSLLVRRPMEQETGTATVLSLVNRENKGVRNLCF